MVQILRAIWLQLHLQLKLVRTCSVLLLLQRGGVNSCLGEKEMQVRVGDQVRDLIIKLPWKNIFSVVSTTSGNIIKNYPELFDNSGIIVLIIDIS